MLYNTTSVAMCLLLVRYSRSVIGAILVTIIKASVAMAATSVAIVTTSGYVKISDQL